MSCKRQGWSRNGAPAAPGIMEEALSSGSMILPEMETSYLLVLRDELPVWSGGHPLIYVLQTK